MNKYFIKVPYFYTKYGELTCHVYAEDEESAAELVKDYNERYNEDYDDNDDSGDTNFEYENSDIDLEEENVVPPTPNHSTSKSSFSKLPSYFLNEINLI